MKQFKIVLFDLKEELVNAWKKVLPKEQYPFVECVVSNFTTLRGTAIVSPANSFGFMNGGIDGAYTAHFGQPMVDTLQALIFNKWNGELPIGCADIVSTGHNEVPFLIAAPTMRVPMAIDDTVNVYLSTRAALLSFQKELFHPDNFMPEILLIPGMGTGVGRVSPELCASQMKKAIDHVVLKKYTAPETLEHAYHRHASLLQPLKPRMGE